MGKCFLQREVVALNNSDLVIKRSFDVVEMGLYRNDVDDSFINRVCNSLSFFRHKNSNTYYR